MAYQKPPSFEDLEPEGENIELTDGFEDEDDFFEEALSAIPLDTHEFEDSAALDEFDEFDRDPPAKKLPQKRRTRPGQRKSLADLAAQAALKGSQPVTNGTASSGNGHQSVSPKPAQAPTDRSKEVDGEWEADLFDVAAEMDDVEHWSAALVEDYELLETLAATAAATRNRAEAEGLVAAMVPLSLRLAPRAYRALWPALPALIRGAVGVTRLLHQRPASRRLLELLPCILENTVDHLARYVEAGQPLPRLVAGKVLAKQTATILSHIRSRGRSRRPRSKW